MALKQPDEQAQVSVNAVAYLAAKANGSAKVVKINGDAFITQRLFDQLTGKPKSVLLPVEVERMELLREDAKKGLDALDVLIADLKSAKELAA